MSVYVLKDNYGDSIACVRLAVIDTVGFREWIKKYEILINGQRIATYNTIGQAKAEVKRISDALAAYLDNQKDSDESNDLDELNDLIPNQW